jgi:3-deoxy-manno-octulosonate cytidylyltransferase (CMP-KDO synthetase)
MSTHCPPTVVKGANLDSSSIGRSALIVIPARMGSARLPQKPLSLIHGVPMIVRVWRKAIEAGVAPVVVACDHQDIASLIQDAGGQAILTEGQHATGSDRVWEAVQRLDPQGQVDVVINLQGDLPVFPPGVLSDLVRPFQDPHVQMSTLIQDVRYGHEKSVKVRVETPVNREWVRCLDFSRKAQNATFIHQGVYAFRRQALGRFAGLAQTEHELSESLEQLRALDHGFYIAGIDVGSACFRSVNTPQDLEVVCKILQP